MGNPPEKLKPYELERFRIYKNRSLGERTASTELSKVSISIGASGSKAADRGAKIEKASVQSLRDGGNSTPGNNPDM